MNNDIDNDSNPSKLMLKHRLMREAAANDDFDSAARFQSEVKQLEAKLNTYKLGSHSTNIVTKLVGVMQRNSPLKCAPSLHMPMEHSPAKTPESQPFSKNFILILVVVMTWQVISPHQSIILQPCPLLEYPF